MNYCLYCGKELKVKSHNKNGIRRYCNNDCYAAARNKHYGIATCLYCGKQFKETRDRPNRFCCVVCSGKYYGEIRTTKRIRKDEIKAEYKKLKKRYERTQRQLEKIKQREESIIKRTKNCIVCGKQFVGFNSLQKCCCKECSKKHTQYRKDKRLYRNGKPNLSISLTKLYMRDGGICQLCGREINFDGNSNSKRYPSIDHIIPLSKGGKHEWDNVQLACRGCNTKKGADANNTLPVRNFS